MPSAFEPFVEDDALREKMNSLVTRDQFESLGDIPKIRTMTFEASRFSTERCLYFTGIAERLVAQGSPTAALGASYLGMIFGSRAIMALLGVSYCFHQNFTWMFDVWPGACELTSQGKRKHWEARISAMVGKLRFGHEQHWKLFIRLRSVAFQLPLDENEIGALRRIKDHSGFSSRRNSVQYADFWPYLDLTRLFIDTSIGLLPANFDIQQENLDHDLKFAQILALCASSMTLDVLSPLKRHSAYCLQLKSRLSPEWHPLLNAGGLTDRLKRLTANE